MLKNTFSLSWIGRLGISLSLAFLVWGFFIYSQPDHTTTAVLQGDVSIVTTRNLGEENKIQPGTKVKLKLKVENIGHDSSANGEVYIRYAFAKPLHTQPNSALFETEKVSLPSIKSGDSIELVFDALHYLPTLFDFVRNDWPMREYQAIVKIDGSEKIIGTLALTISAYYYPGIQKEYSVEVPSLLETVSPAN